MSKIAEQKALETYPIAYYRNGGGIDDANASDRAVYEEAYDQAMQDFLEKACDYLQKNLWRVITEDGEFRQRFVTDFKNHMQDE